MDSEDWDLGRFGVAEGEVGGTVAEEAIAVERGGEGGGEGVREVVRGQENSRRLRSCHRVRRM